MMLLAALTLHVLPRPQNLSVQSCSFPLTRSLRVSANFDPGAAEEIDERWRALGIPSLVKSRTGADIRVQHANLPAQAYRLQTRADGTVTIAASDADGAFYAAMTLAQLPQRTAKGWAMPCVRIADAPALRWRILSDDVSRGPLPNMRYFKERIRTIAAFKFNGYSPYMEHVFADPHDPLPAPLDGITSAQLRELDAYARRFHVTFIPEQQTFAHMHNTLRYETYAPAAELPHAFLLSPASSMSVPYVGRLIKDELAAVPHPPFFHIGSDETSSLGKGQSAPMVAQRGLTQVYAEHINRMNAIVKPSGARIMLWDDGIENDPAIMKLIPRNAVIVNWHYGAEKTFMPYISLLAKGGFDQMVSPGDSNWNQIFPDVNTALRNERTFINEGKRAHVLGLFQTVWHDDGESLFEATWYPVLYAGVSAWETGDVDPARYQTDFPFAFFGSGDARYGSDVARLADIQTRMADAYQYSSNYLMWADPFDQRASAHMDKVDVRQVRLNAEAVETHLLGSTPPLHRNAARVMFLAARKYDLIGRKFQAAKEIADMYADAAAHAHQKGSPSGRDLLWTKYWFWELRDGYEELAPLYAQAWRYEDRQSHLASNLERYHLNAQRNIERADAVYAATLDYYAGKPLPPLGAVLSPSVTLRYRSAAEPAEAQ
ncbi:MAG TPA: glycoside hydrolase family 20 zincin-like fold domain-containing protein [Candidatus Baltobacteraceae bacterium]|nr:glycoside hydrolase family 20 zincin-like fold domain-containing protein [Candidatus Baltobacteraceae bacterium]